MFNNNISQTYNFQDASQEIIIMLLGAFLLGCLLTWLLNKLFNKNYDIENTEYRYEQRNDEINVFSNTKVTQASTTGDVRIVEKPTNPINTSVNTDDLTKISGIDSKIQGELKNANISSFKDLRDISTKDLVSFKKSQPSLDKEIETWPHQASLAEKGEWNKLTEYQGFVKRVQLASTTSQAMDSVEADDLTQLEGITPEIENILFKNNVSTFKQLSHMDSDALKGHITSENTKFVESDAESWPHQAAMAEKGQWEELKIYQDFMHSDTEVTDVTNNVDSKQSEQIDSKKSQEKTNPTAETPKKVVDTHITNDDELTDENLSDHDDLKKVEGIGPKIEEVLNQGGIYTFSQLYNSDRNRLRKLLDDAGSQFKMHDPESWPHQAGMANRNEWEELKSYQNSINREKNSDKNIIPKKANGNGNLSIAHPKDDLTRIEGIGPKIQEVLNDSGTYTYKRLAQVSSASIKDSLNAAGPQFRMHDPETWPQQALLASKSEWDVLKDYQEEIVNEQALKANKESTAKTKKNKSDSNATSNLKDDLKKIEGIGPKIEELLNNAGINSFDQLSQQSRDFIKELLNEAGPQFRMHEPESWPHQAKLAAKNDWNELEKYQEFLSTGRE